MPKIKFKSITPNMSNAEKIAVLRHNNEVKKSIEIAIWKTTQEVQNISDSPNNIRSNTKTIAYKKDPNNISPELSNLFTKILEFDITSLEEDAIIAYLKELINVDKKYQKSLINKLKLLLYREIGDYSKLYLHSDEASKKEALAIINSLKIKIDLLEELEENEELSSGTTLDDDRNFLFMMNENGKILFLETIKSHQIPNELYASVKNLLMEAKKGNFKRVKRLSPRPFFEIRFDDIRIIMSRLNNHTFLIFDIFLKKGDMRLHHKSLLDNLEDKYLPKKDYYFSIANLPQVVEEHATYYQDILRVLDNKKESLGEYNGR